MKTSLLVPIPLLLLGSLLPAGHADDLRDLSNGIEVSLQEAVAQALAAQPGAAVAAEVEKDDDLVVIEVIVVAADGLHEIAIDGSTGKVLENDHETGDDAVEEAAYFRAILRHSELDLAALIGKAQEVVNGRPCAAEFDFEGMNPICDVGIANGRYLIDVELEARAGHITEIELAGWEADEGDDDDEDEDEEDDDDDEDEDDEEDDED